MAALIIQTPEREQYLSFTAPYISSPYVIFACEQDDLILDIRDLAGKTLAVTRGFVIQAQLTRDYPAIRQALFDSDEQALQAVATGQVDAYIGGLTVASHIIHKRGFSDLRVVAPAPFGEQSMSMGNRKDWPELTAIISKALASITEAEKTAIRNKYVALRYKQGVGKAEVLKWSLVLFGTAFGIIALFTFWNRSLSKKVRDRTVELESSNQSLSLEVAERTKVENALRENRDYLKTLMDSLPDAVFSVKLPEREIVWANDTFKVFGYEPDECVGKTTEFLYPEKQGFLAFGNATGHAIAEGKEVLQIEQVMRKKDGEYFPADIKVSLFRTGGDVVSVTAIVANITERKQAEQKLAAYQERLKALAAQLTIVEERERRSIAVDLHDNVGQSLTLSRLQLAAAIKAAEDADLRERLSELSQTLLQAVQDTRHLMFELSSPTLNEIGLGAAIEEWADVKIKKRYGIDVEQVDELELHDLDEDLRALLFRHVRELLLNVVKHARASKIGVRLEKEGRDIRVTVQDNGIGFDPEQVAGGVSSEGGFGLFSIQERLTDLGGTLAVKARSNGGTSIVMTVPGLAIKTGVSP